MSKQGSEYDLGGDVQGPEPRIEVSELWGGAGTPHPTPHFKTSHTQRTNHPSGNWSMSPGRGKVGDQREIRGNHTAPPPPPGRGENNSREPSFLAACQGHRTAKTPAVNNPARKYQQTPRQIKTTKSHFKWTRLASKCHGFRHTGAGAGKATAVDEDVGGGDVQPSVLPVGVWGGGVRGNPQKSKIIKIIELIVVPADGRN